MVLSKSPKRNPQFPTLHSKFSSGFTLIEIITVIAVIGVLVAALIAVLDPITQIKKSNDTKRKSDLAQIQRSLEAYYQDNGSYPPSCSGQVATSTPCVPASIIPWGASWTPYMETLPKDPNGSRNYAYKSDATGQSYYLYASLEYVGDPSMCINATTACTNSTTLPAVTCGSAAICNYGVTSPNVSP